MRKQFMKKEKLLFLTVISALVVNANAQSDKAVELNPVTVTGTGTYHKADNTPIAVKVISAKELKDAQVSSLQDALAKLSSDITTSTNGMGTFVNFNGVSDDYIVILENGKRISGDDRWDRISIDNIKRIEILSGAASALYGSDAIAGVINIITDESKDPVDVTSRTRFSSKGRFDQDVNVDVTEGKFSSYTSYNHRQADNWQVNNYQEFMEGDVSVPKLTGRPMSQGFRSENISERLEWRFSEHFDIYARGNLYDHATKRPQSAAYYTQKAKTDKETGETTYEYTSKQAYTYDIHHQSYNVGAGARWTPNKNTHVYLDIYNDNFNSEYDYWQTLETEGYSESRKRTHYWNETLKGIFRLNSWNKLSGGIELVQENLKSASDNIESESMNTSNLFAQDEIQICKVLEAVAGFRYTHNSNFGSHFTPNAALFFHVGGFRLRASYAGGYRTPTLSQLYATDQAKTNKRYTLNNENLKPEKNDFWNLNAEYSNEWVRASISTYVNKIRNMINYRTMRQSEIDASGRLTAIYEDGWTTIRQRDNIDKATVKGLSMNVKFLLPGGFALGGGYTYTDSKAETMSLNSDTQIYEYTKTPVDKCVRNVGNVNVTWDRSWKNYHLNINLNGHIQGERYSSTYGYAPAYSQWDLNTKHTIALKNFTLEPGIGIENIFNKRDTSYWNSNFSTVNPGRAGVVSLKLTM